MKLIAQVDKHIEDLRDYLRNRLRQNRLSTDYRDGFRVKQYNAKVKPESIPEHNDPFRIDWTEVNGKKFFVGTEVSLPYLIQFASELTPRLYVYPVLPASKYDTRYYIEV